MKFTTRKMRDWRGVTLKPLHEDHEPIPGEIESRFTKDKEAQELFQVFLDMQGEKEPTPVTPKMIRVACEEVLAAFNKAIIDGKANGWGNPHIARAA